MTNKIIITIIILFCIGCATDKREATQASQLPESTQLYLADQAEKPGPGPGLDPFDIDPQALPDMRDFPMPQKQIKAVRQYTGVIKNKTRYDVVVPSANSGATLDVPAKGWIEYTIWTRNYDLTVYRNGKPFYCLKLIAHPGDYPYMCKRYDFMAEIVKPEEGKKYKRSKMKRRIKKRAPEPEKIG